MQPTTKPSSFGQTQCLYWDIDQGAWSLEGCAVTLYNETHLECIYNHLTDFITDLNEFGVDHGRKYSETPSSVRLFVYAQLLRGMGVILGSQLDASSKVNQSDHLANMLQLDSCPKHLIEVLLLVRVPCAMFLVANGVLVLLAIVVVPRIHMSCELLICHLRRRARRDTPQYQVAII
jgi:hypothetical protein